MEKAILKTLIYADIFDYPLKAYEIHKWLIARKATFQQVEKALIRLSQKSKVKSKKGYFFLDGRDKLIRIRQQREKQSKRFLWKAKFSVWFLRLFPTIKLVGISGGLALNNAESGDDIDLFLVTAKNRIWICRILIIFILDMIGIRRKVGMSADQAAGKICTNILVEEDKLEQVNKDLFVAHEVLQMKVLWQKDNIYSKYLADNTWAFDFLPNWRGSLSSESGGIEYKSKRRQKEHNFNPIFLDSLLNFLEQLAKKFQLWYMKSPKGMERIGDGVLYFHPNDIRAEILSDYIQKLRADL